MANRGKHVRRGPGRGATVVKIILSACVVLVIAAAGTRLLLDRDGAVSTDPPAAASETPAQNTSDTDATAGETAPPESALPAQPSASPVAPSARPSSDIAAGSAAAIGANLSVTVPANGRVDDSYFDDAVFIGDSRTEGLKMYSGLPVSRFWSQVSLTVTKAFEDRFVEVNGQWLTVSEALAQAEYGKVYIMLGVNELGWPYEDVFTENYARLIDIIRETHPDATIYVQSIIPVSKWLDGDTEANRGYNTIANVLRLQTALCKMCEDKQVNYVNVAEVMQDSEGYLFSEATKDGIHLTADYCRVWMEYLRTHTV